MTPRTWTLYVELDTRLQLELLARKMGLISKGGPGKALGLGAPGQLLDFIAKMVRDHGVDQVVEWLQGTCDIHWTEDHHVVADVAEIISKHGQKD